MSIGLFWLYAGAMTQQDEAAALLSEIAGARASALRLSDGVLSFVLDISGLGAAEAREMERAARESLGAIAGVKDVRALLTAERAQRSLIAVASGKGGVGKSTLSANLAVALNRAGRKVGLVDADIYGPSQPVLMDCAGKRPQAREKKLIPVETPYGVPVLSMGHLADPGQAIAWRGPMAGNALGQLIDADWGDAEILVADLPPGTGDVQLSMVQRHKPAGAVIVSTPQDLSLIDARRAAALFEQTGVPIIGLVENMAGYECPHCGKVSDPFGTGGAEAAAEEMGLPFLGRIPLALAIREASDQGKPPAAGDGEAADAFAAIAAKIGTWIDNRGAGKRSGS